MRHFCGIVGKVAMRILLLAGVTEFDLSYPLGLRGGESQAADIQRDHTWLLPKETSRFAG